MLYEKMTMPLGYLVDMSTDYQRIRVDVLKYVNADSAEKRNKFYEEIMKERAALDAVDEKYTKTFIDENDRKLFEEYARRYRDPARLDCRNRPAGQGRSRREARHPGQRRKVPGRLPGI